MQNGWEQVWRFLGTQFWMAGQAFRPLVPNFPLFPPFVELPHNAMRQPRGWGLAIWDEQFTLSRALPGWDGRQISETKQFSEAVN